MSTYIYSFKCLHCGLHFNVYSWETSWTELHTAFCPECGKQGAPFPLQRRETDKEIFNYVPGPPNQEVIDWLRSQGLLDPESAELKHELLRIKGRNGET